MLCRKYKKFVNGIQIKVFMLQDIQRWLIMFSVGILTALVACSIDITIEMLAKVKYGLLREWTDHCVEGETNLRNL